MTDGENEGKKAEVLRRIDRLRELVEQDAPAILLDSALEQVGRSLDGLTRPGRGQGEETPEAASGESPPSL